MITVTSDDIPGMTITSTKGIVYGNSVRARNIGRDITAAELLAYGTAGAAE